MQTHFKSIIKTRKGRSKITGFSKDKKRFLINRVNNQKDKHFLLSSVSDNTNLTSNPF